VKVIIGCERSGVVREAFRKLGHDAWSCDLEPADDGSQYHIQDDILNHLDGWDLGIFHPTCTALCVSGNATYAEGKEKYPERLAAIKWTENLWDEALKRIEMVAFENPIGVLSTCSKLGKATQYIQPWQFGHGETKKTGLWLHNLPKLIPTNIVEGREEKVWKMSPGPERSRLRSVTYQGIADCMAEQWS
jgi:hypothetical protein